MNADKLAEALRKLIFAAQTSGGVSGRDDELCRAIGDASIALDEHDTRPAQATWSDERPPVMWLPNRISAKDLAFSTTDECLAYQNGWNHCIEATLSSPENKMRKPDAVDKACEAVAAASHRLFYGSGPAQATQPVGVPDGWKQCYSTIISAIGAIARIRQTDAQMAMEVIPRDPAMAEVMHIRAALGEFNRSQRELEPPAQPSADAVSIAADISTRPEFAKYESPLILDIVSETLKVARAARDRGMGACR